MGKLFSRSDVRVPTVSDGPGPGWEAKQAEIIRLLDLLIEGRFQSIPAGDDPIDRKIAELGRVMERRGLAHLKDLVAMSIISNQGVNDVASMMRSVSDTNHRSQGVATAAEELVASVREIASRAESAAGDAAAVQQSARSSQESAGRAVDTMAAISRSVDEAAGKVDTLAEASAQIGTIIDQIEAIAKQTNLLALNATIEAARAGEAGKGFAVVAGEVKNLANQTGRATVDIRTRIETLRSEMGSIVASMQESARMVEKGQEVIIATGEGIREVTREIQQASEKIGDISAILTQQSSASGEVAQGIVAIADDAAENVRMISAVMDVLAEADVTITNAVPELMKLEITDKTVHVAKSDHMIWRRKLAQMVVGKVKLNPNELADHHHCRLGKWYDAIPEGDIRQHPAFKALEGPHRDVHALGIEAARKFQSGDIHGALENVGYAGAASIPVMFYLDQLIARHTKG
ncbi:MAG: methyl-accepting chemotaxis protein [Alphaproteobacteria bacterium]